MSLFFSYVHTLERMFTVLTNSLDNFAYFSFVWWAIDLSVFFVDWNLCRHTCSSTTVSMASGSITMSRWRTQRPFYLMRNQSLYLASGMAVRSSFTSVVLIFNPSNEALQFSCGFSAGTLKKSRGAKLGPSLLLSLLEFSLTRKRPLPT